MKAGVWIVWILLGCSGVAQDSRLYDCSTNSQIAKQPTAKQSRFIHNLTTNQSIRHQDKTIHPGPSGYSLLFHIVPYVWPVHVYAAYTCLRLMIMLLVVRSRFMSKWYGCSFVVFMFSSFHSLMYLTFKPLIWGRLFEFMFVHLYIVHCLFKLSPVPLLLIDPHSDSVCLS